MPQGLKTLLQRGPYQPVAIVRGALVCAGPEVHLPPLCERGDDILPLAQHFLDGFRKRNACRARSFTADAGDAMRAFAWPGNVRELINRVQRAAVVAEHESLSPEDLDLPRAVATATGDEGDRLGAARLQAERDAVLALWNTVFGG